MLQTSSSTLIGIRPARISAETAGRARRCCAGWLRHPRTRLSLKPIRGSRARLTVVASRARLVPLEAGRRIIVGSANCDAPPTRDVVLQVEQQAVDDRPQLVIKPVLDPPPNPARRAPISWRMHVAKHASEFAHNVPARRNPVAALLFVAELSQHRSVLPKHLSTAPLKLRVGPLAFVQPGLYPFPGSTTGYRAIPSSSQGRLCPTSQPARRGASSSSTACSSPASGRSGG